MKINLKSISKKSLQIVWNNPILWLFGIFASLFITNRISLALLNINKVISWIENLMTLQILQDSFQFSLNLVNNLTSLPLYNLIIIISFIIIPLYIAILSQVIIISYISQLKTTPKKDLKLGKIFKNSHKSIWKIILVYTLSILITFIIFYLFKISFKFALSIPILYYIITFILISLIIGLIIRFIILTIIIEKKKFFPAIQKGWLIFWKNFFQIIKTCLFLFFITFLFGLALLLISSVIAFPFTLIIILFLYIKSDIGFHILTIIWPIIQTIITTLFIAMFSVFQYSVWTNFYHKINPFKNKWK